MTTATDATLTTANALDEAFTQLRHALDRVAGGEHISTRNGAEGLLWSAATAYSRTVAADVYALPGREWSKIEPDLWQSALSDLSEQIAAHTVELIDAYPTEVWSRFEQPFSSRLRQAGDDALAALVGQYIVDTPVDEFVSDKALRLARAWVATGPRLL